MTLTAGDRLGPYEIVESIGKGGMGEVFRARDTRLGRDVAIKVSAQKFGERFEREARVISSLNHPNVCTLHDVGDNYLVMELVEGETLSARTKQGPIPVDEALTISRQIAAALEAAHEKGIVHRDLKPGNVMLKADGTIKVLDFGLAKTGPQGLSSSSSPDPDASPTISMAATQAGAVLGTAAYMAPEQARGKPVDKRADIWAFGVVLCEMVTGKKLFAGEDLTDTLASVVKIDPDLSTVPVELQPLIKKCLEKDPRKRLRDISDVDALLELGRAKAAPQTAAAGTPPATRSWRTWVVSAVATVAIAAVAWWIGTRSVPEPPAPQVVRTILNLDKTLLGDASLEVSRDGSKIVYPAEEGLRVWRLDSFESTLLPGTMGARLPFFSPDGQQVAYVDGFSAGPLKRISVNGGPSGVIVEKVTGALGAKWMENGEILYSNGGQGIFSVPANGGQPKLVVKEAAPLIYPQLLPGGNQVLFSLNAITAQRQIVVQDLANGTRRTLANGAMGTFVKTGKQGGHLVFWAAQPTSQMLALALDKDYNPVGSPFPMVNGIGVGLVPKFGVSESGTMVYQSGAGGSTLGSLDGIRTLAWVDASGKETPLPAPPDNYRIARISPTGDRVAIQVGFQIWIWNVRNQNFARLPDFGKPMVFPAWTPDGQRIIFRTNEDDGQALYSIAADGSGKFQKVLAAVKGGNVYPYKFTPDNRTLIATMPTPTGARPFAIPMGKDWVAAGEPRLLRAESQFLLVDAAVDPSGKWLVYTALANGQPLTSFSPYPDAGSQQIPLGAFAQPVWSHSGKVLYAANAAQGLVAVDVDTSNGLKLGKPEVVIPNNYYWGAEGRAWDLAPDGRFLLMKTPSAAPVVQQDATPKIRVVVNWSEELKKQVPLP
jgi:serine/threonine protein kinase/Tol biopolymer transport system component